MSVTQRLFSKIRFWKGGPLLRNVSGVIEARNAADSAYAIVRGLTPVGNTDLTTKLYVDGAIDTDVAAALTDPTFNDSTDPTKEATLDLSGITTATERTIVVPDTDITLCDAVDPIFNDGTDQTKQAHLVLSGITTSTNRALTVQDKDITIADDADIDTLRPGSPMFNRLRLLGAPGAAVEGNTVTIGADVYEFRGSTPPAGGTAGRIWVYNGADSAASRTNLINAINGVVDAATITRDGTNTETVVASAGITTGDVVIKSATAIGGSVTPSASVIACAETLATATDVWDQANTYGGLALQPRSMMALAITLTADMVAKGTVEFFVGFTPIAATVTNRSRPQDEAYTISGNAVSLTLAGGGSPNNQAGDIIDVVAFG